MELERLEVLLEINTERVQESINKVMPQINGMLNRIEQATGRSSKTIENNMDMSSATKNIEGTLNNFVNTFSKQMDRMEETSKKKATTTSRNLEQGFKQTRTLAGKEIDLMVKDINAKMGQARAAQNKIAHLTAQRTSAVRDNDSGAVVRYDEQIANAEAKMTSYRNKATEMARAMQAEFDAVPSSLDRISATMEANEIRIETMRSKIADMQTQYESQRKSSGSFREGFSTEDSPDSRDTMLKIQEQAEKMNKLIASNDQLQQAYANTETRAQSLRQALGGLNNNLSRSSIQMGNASQGIQTVAESSDQATSMWSRFGGVFNRTSNFIAHGARKSSGIMSSFFSMFGRGSNNAVKSTGNMGKSTGMLGRTISQLGRRIFVYGMLYRGIMALGKGMFSALKTNDQFASSLNQIQVNLMTAFYPIYQAVLPAINALMSALARVTGYIASFVATLFGTTYTAAKKGAQGLYSNVQAMEETGTGATKAKDKVKELQRSLMGFDEINRIGLDVDTDDSDLDSGSGGTGGPGGVNFDTPDYSTPAWLKNFANNVRDIMRRLFDPVKSAWDKHGKAVMDAFKYALNESWGLVKSIGRSFMEVWTNGTGEKFIGNILRLLTTVLNIIGDVARAFRLAWDDGGRGTALIQAIFDMWNSILNLLIIIGETFRTVWNDGTGQRIAANILEIYTNVYATIGELADRFSEAWLEASNGERIFGVLLGLAEKYTETINNNSKALREWAENLNLEPLLSATAGMLESLEPIIASALDGLNWLYENTLLPIAKWAVENGIPAAIDAISAAFDLLGAIIDVIKPVLSWLWNDFLVPISNWAGDAAVWVLESLGSALSVIGDFVSRHQTGFSNFVIAFAGFVGALKVISGLSSLIGILTGTFGALSSIGGLSGILSSVSGAIGGIMTMLGGPWALAVGAAIGVGVLLWRNWDEVKEKASELRDTISDKWEGISSATSTWWGKVKDRISGDSKTSSDEATSNYKDLEINSSSAFGGIWSTVKRVFPGLSKDVTDNSSKANKNSSGSFKTLKDNVSNRVSESWESVKSNFGNIQSWVSDKSENARRNGVSAFSRMKSGMSEYLSEIQTKTSEVFDKITGWASGLGSKIGSGLRNGIEAVKRGSASIANGIIGTIGKAVNGVINGINWILDKVGASNKKLSTWSVPSYAKGTNSHPGGLALVNDAPGSKYREAFEVNGKVGLFPKQRNMLVNLPKGAKVLDGNRTDALYGDVPRYASGVGNWFSKAWNGAKEMTGTVWDYISNPSKLLDIAISKFVNLSSAIEPSLSIAKGAISTVASSATDFVKGFLETGGDEGSEAPVGSGVARWRSTVIRALSMNGLPTTEAYISAWLRQIQTESGGNEKAVQSTAVKDINYYTGNLARGLVQVIPPTFRAYAFPGYNNPFNGLHSLLAGMNYAKSRYGVTGMLRAVGRGRGYENGGLVSNDGYYRLAEGDKKELVIPLERKNRALELIEVAKDYLGVSDSPTLQMPEVMLGSPTNRFSTPAPNREVGSGLNGMTESMMQTLMNLLADSNSDETIEVVMEMDGDRIGDATIKRINRKTKQAGKSPLIQ